MIYAPNMLLIGAMGRDVGKTAFAEELLRRFAGEGVYGAKVTAIQEVGGACPRGGEGCGVCSSLEGPYCLTEETVSGATKDTQRLLAAGARRVFWLRALREELETGVRVLLETIDGPAPVIAESNSLRHILEPGLFCMVRREGSKDAKMSARAVRAFADIVVESDGSRFDLDFDRIGLAEGYWTFRYPATAVLLAGGQSGRMGTDRCLPEAGGRPMIARLLEWLRPHVDEVILSAPGHTRYPFLNVRTIPDDLPNAGPLAAMITALDATDTDLNLVVSCDIAWVDIRLLHQLFRAIGGHDAAVPVTPAEPLFALYRKSALRAMRAAWHDGVRDVGGMLASCDVAYVPMCDGCRLSNIDTPADYETFLTELKNEGSI